MSNNNPWEKELERLESGNTTSKDTSKENSGFSTIALNEGFGSETTKFSLEKDEKHN